MSVTLKEEIEWIRFCLKFTYQNANLSEKDKEEIEEIWKRYIL